MEDCATDRLAQLRLALPFSRRSLRECLSDWSQRTGIPHAYSSRLPDVPVVVSEPGRVKSLRGVLRHLGWVARMVGGRLVVIRGDERSDLERHREVLLTSPDEGARRRSAYALGRLSTPEVVSTLVAGLRDESASVRFHCLESLWALEDDFWMWGLPGRASLFEVGLKDAKPLLELATGCEDRARRTWRYAVDILGRAGIAEVRPLALAALEDDDGRVRLTAARALRHTARPEDAPILIDFARRSEDWAARREVLLALVRLPGPRGVGFVLRAASGRDEELACLACEALASAEEVVVEGARVIETLGRVLNAKGPERAELAAEALGRRPERAAETALLTVLRSNGESWRRSAAARGLAGPGRERSRQALRALLAASGKTGRSSPEIRAAVAEALAACPEESALDGLTRLAEDAEPPVRLAAARALKRRGGRRALPPLRKLTLDPDKRVANEALKGLGWLGGAAEARRLARIALDRSLGRDGPEAAISALADLTTPQARRIAVDTLVKLMKHPQTCPYAVGRAAVKIADERLVPGLIAILKDSSCGGLLRVDAMDALGRIGTPEAIEALLDNWWEYHNMPRYQVGRALRDNAHRPEVRKVLLEALKRKGMHQVAAAFSLSQVRDPDAVDALAEVLHRADDGFIAAGTSLGLICDPATTSTLLKVATDRSHPGRFVAGRALRMRDLAWQPEVRKTLVELYGWRPDGSPPPIEKQEPGTWVLRRYARDFDDMSISTLCYESGVTLDTRRGRIVQWGAHGRRYDTPQTGETWIYNPDTNTWTEVGLRECPPGTCSSREVSYDPVNDRVIVTKGGGGGHGWLAIKEQNLRISIPWVYDPERDRWTAMRPLIAPVFGSYPAHAFDRRHGVLVAFSHHTQPPAIWTYDPYTNQWHPQPAHGPVPMVEGYGHTMTYDFRRGRVVFGGRGILAAYELASGRWYDLRRPGQPPNFAPLIYDLRRDRLLAFEATNHGVVVHLFDPTRGVWRREVCSGMQPDYREWDAEYDPERDVVFICGGEVTGNPGSPNCRETWTYRPRGRAVPIPLRPPLDARVVVTHQRARLSWRAPQDERVVGFNIYRAQAERTWRTDFRKLNPRPVTSTEFVDRKKLVPGCIYIYLVRSVDAEGRESPEPVIARTQPPVPIGVVATHRSDGLVVVTWEAPEAGDVVGYNIYRAPVEFGDLYGEKPVESVGTFVRINRRPIRTRRYLDPDPPSRGTRGWTYTPRAYCVRAVSAHGVESGPSPWVVTLPAPVQRIRTRRREDGSVVVRWDKNPDPNVVGYVVYRQDNWRNDLLHRVNAVPTAATVLVDPEGRPTGERQRYWVVAVDAVGQEGPSGTGAWSFNRP